jgi:hypothetical protein
MPDGHVVTAREVEDELARVGHDLQPFDIVLVNTRASECYGTDEYLTAGAGSNTVSNRTRRASDGD